MATQFQHKLSFKEIENMRNQIITLLSTLNTNKHRMMSHDFRQLNNHLQFALNTLGNMHNILTVERSDPYSSQQANYSGIPGNAGMRRKVIYNPDGTTRIVNAGNPYSSNSEEWEKQFDEGLLMRPPCFQVPPQNMTNITRIRQAGDHDMVKEL